MRTFMQQVGQEGVGCVFADIQFQPRLRHVDKAASDCDECVSACLDGLLEEWGECRAVECRPGVCTIYSASPELSGVGEVSMGFASGDAHRLGVRTKDCFRKQRVAFMQVGDDQASCSWKQSGDTEPTYYHSVRAIDCETCALACGNAPWCFGYECSAHNATGIEQAEHLIMCKLWKRQPRAYLHTDHLSVCFQKAEPEFPRQPPPPPSPSPSPPPPSPLAPLVCERVVLRLPSWSTTSSGTPISTTGAFPSFSTTSSGGPPPTSTSEIKISSLRDVPEYILEGRRRCDDADFGWYEGAYQTATGLLSGSSSAASIQRLTPHWEQVAPWLQSHNGDHVWSRPVLSGGSGSSAAYLWWRPARAWSPVSAHEANAAGWVVTDEPPRLLPDLLTRASTADPSHPADRDDTLAPPSQQPLAVREPLYFLPAPSPILDDDTASLSLWRSTCGDHVLGELSCSTAGTTTATLESAERAPPRKPTLLRAGCGCILIGWEVAKTDTSFRILFSPEPGPPSTKPFLAGTSAAGSFELRALAPASSYAIQVEANRGGEWSDVSTPLRVRTLDPAKVNRYAPPLFTLHLDNETDGASRRLIVQRAAWSGSTATCGVIRLKLGALSECHGSDFQEVQISESLEDGRWSGWHQAVEHVRQQHFAIAVATPFRVYRFRVVLHADVQINGPPTDGVVVDSGHSMLGTDVWPDLSTLRPRTGDAAPFVLQREHDAAPRPQKASLVPIVRPVSTGSFAVEPPPDSPCRKGMRWRLLWRKSLSPSLAPPAPPLTSPPRSVLMRLAEGANAAWSWTVERRGKGPKLQSSGSMVDEREIRGAGVVAMAAGRAGAGGKAGSATHMGEPMAQSGEVELEEFGGLLHAKALRCPHGCTFRLLPELAGWVVPSAPTVSIRSPLLAASAGHDAVVHLEVKFRRVDQAPTPEQAAAREARIATQLQTTLGVRSLRVIESRYGSEYLVIELKEMVRDGAVAVLLHLQLEASRMYAAGRLSDASIAPLVGEIDPTAPIIQIMPDGTTIRCTAPSIGELDDATNHSSAGAFAAILVGGAAASVGLWAYFVALGWRHPFRKNTHRVGAYSRVAGAK